MYLLSRIFSVMLCMLVAKVSFAQKPNAVEVGLNFAGDERPYYGGYSKFVAPLAQQQHYFTIGFSLTVYFDFKGESEPKARLKKDVDMRIIPAVHLGYALNFDNFQFNFELPIGTSIAITKGTLINERVGFERKYSNTEFLWHYGIGISPKYKLNNKNLIGLYYFAPLVPDKTWSGKMLGIGWTSTLPE